MPKGLEIAMVMANTPSVDGWNLHWIVSKSQVEYVLRDIATLPPRFENDTLQRAQYQDSPLPVVSLEQHFGLSSTEQSLPYKYIILKIPTDSQKVEKIILRTVHPIRVRKLTFNSAEAQHTGLKQNYGDILGAYTLPDNQLLIIPDLNAILATLA